MTPELDFYFQCGLGCTLIAKILKYVLPAIFLPSCEVFSINVFELIKLFANVKVPFFTTTPGASLAPLI